MALELTVEDGSIVADANTYITLGEVRAYAEARAAVVSEDDAVLIPQVISAMDFLEAHRAEFQGSKVSKEQALQWPREDVTLDGFDVEETEIPKPLKDAQCQMVLEIAAGNDLQPNSTGREVIREKLDVLETQYQPSGTGAPPAPRFTRVAALLQPLLRSGASGALVSIGRA